MEWKDEDEPVLAIFEDTNFCFFPRLEEHFQRLAILEREAEHSVNGIMFRYIRRTINAFLPRFFDF
jgi:hypothetical protein